MVENVDKSIKVVLLFGSNDAEAGELVRRAVAIVDLAVGQVTKLSDEYASAPFGFTSERGFVNCAAEITTKLGAYEVLRRINLIEALLGRDRTAEAQVKSVSGEPYASRPIDIDIIFYGTETFSDERLTIPYHFLAERGYALRPVVDVAPDLKHPALELTPKQMLEMLDNDTNI